MQHEQEQWDDFEASSDFNEKLMQKIAAEPIPKLPLWRRMEQWESRRNESPALRFALRAAALLAGAANVTGLYLFLIGA